MKKALREVLQAARPAELLIAVIKMLDGLFARLLKIKDFAIRRGKNAT